MNFERIITYFLVEKIRGGGTIREGATIRNYTVYIYRKKYSISRSRSNI